MKKGLAPILYQHLLPVREQEEDSVAYPFNSSRRHYMEGWHDCLHAVCALTEEELLHALPKASLALIRHYQKEIERLERKQCQKKRHVMKTLPVVALLALLSCTNPVEANLEDADICVDVYNPPCIHVLVCEEVRTDTFIGTACHLEKQCPATVIGDAGTCEGAAR